MNLRNSVVDTAIVDTSSSTASAVALPVVKKSVQAALPMARQTLAAGSAASVLSLLTLLARCVKEGRPPFSGVNAVSHWLWGDRALRQTKPSWRYTASGILIHHLSSMLWGGLFAYVVRREWSLKNQWPLNDMAPSKNVLPYAVATTAVAWVVDYHLTPRRLTPGFEHVVSRRSRLIVYGAFAAGLALGAMAIQSRK